MNEATCVQHGLASSAVLASVCVQRSSLPHRCRDAAARTSFKPGSTVTLDTGFRQSSIIVQRPDGGRDTVQTDATGRVSYPSATSLVSMK